MSRAVSFAAAAAVALLACTFIGVAASSPATSMRVHAKAPTWLSLSSLINPEERTDSLGNGDNGGMDCAVCTIVMSLAGQSAQIHNESIAHSLARLCDLLPKDLQEGCKEAVDFLTPLVIKLIEKDDNPDVVCHGLTLCSGSCHLYPEPSNGILAAGKDARDYLRAETGFKGLPKVCDIPGIKKICDIINNFAGNHYPLDDVDNDGFSPLHTLRGADWRGKDCDDFDKKVHPGAKAVNGDADRDYNCNGISGVDPKSGKPYEDLLCKGTGEMGTIVLGDSASAHFHVPPQYFEPEEWNSDTFDRLMFALENEFDWPMLSASTAFTNSTNFRPDIDGPVNSTYEIMRQRNRCAHRDFQNIAVNGARSGSMNSTIQESMSRIQTSDRPALVLYALIGNDVCNGHPDTLAHMTTTQEMHDNVVSTMEYLDTRLPNGSHVMMMGLADGRILYEALHNRTHPLGKLNNDITYAALYDYLNCLSISPCRGWMNSNATLRNLTTERAQNLSDVLHDIAHNKKYKNFDLYYLPNPIINAIKEWTQKGGQAWQLIEPVDGFHPNQFAQPLIVDQVFKYIGNNYPQIMPPINPNNAEIERLFGDQGGY